MATINEVIERVCRLRPVQALEDGDMAKWLMVLEGMLWNDLVLTSEMDASPPDPPKIWPEDGDKELLAKAPYDRVYDYWLIAQIEFALREYTNYQNTRQLFNQAYQEFAGWFRRQYRGKWKHGFVHVFP